MILGVTGVSIVSLQGVGRAAMLEEVGTYLAARMPVKDTEVSVKLSYLMVGRLDTEATEERLHIPYHAPLLWTPNLE